MSDELGAVLETPDAPLDTGADAAVDTQTTDMQDVARGTSDEKQDGRKQPDALKKHIAELRRQAESITDPVAKKEAQDRIKFLYDTSGKARGYEEQFQTVREAREVKALLDSVGGREGFQKLQSTLSDVEQVDKMLSAGDPNVVNRMWDEAPQGMPKLVGPIADKFEQAAPQEYEKFIAPRAVRFMDSAGFPQAFDRMVQAYEAGNKDQAQAIRDQLIQWVAGNRTQAQQQKQADPEVERLRQELEKTKQTEESRQVDQAYNSVITHAGPAIDKYLKPMVGKLGLTGEQYTRLREQVWDHLQTTRNSNDVYKTVALSKQKQGYGTWTEYAKQWTDDNAEEASRAMVKAWYGHQLQNGAKTQTAVTKTPGAPNIQTGKEPAPSEIDYGPKGKQAAVKAGFKSLEDMILSGQAPLKTGGIRKWR